MSKDNIPKISYELEKEMTNLRKDYENRLHARRAAEYLIKNCSHKKEWNSFLIIALPIWLLMTGALFLIFQSFFILGPMILVVLISSLVKEISIEDKIYHQIFSGKIKSLKSYLREHKK